MAENSKQYYDGRPSKYSTVATAVCVGLAALLVAATAVCNAFLDAKARTEQAPGDTSHQR